MTERQLPEIPTLEQARAEVEAEWEAERERALNFFAREKIQRAEDIHRRAANEQRNREKRAAERAEAEKLARKAWRKVFGRRIAEQLEPWVEYALLPWEDKHLAVRSENLEAVRSAALMAGINTSGKEHAGVLGIHLTRHVTQLAGVDPTPDQIAAVGERKTEAQRQDREAKLKRNKHEAQLQRERQLLGVTVSD